MGCCGNQRQRQYGKQSVVKDSVQMHSPIHDIPPRDHKEVFFQYVGKTGLAVIGPVSEMRYRFVGHGAILSVDPRDRGALVNVPNLRQVKPAS